MQIGIADRGHYIQQTTSFLEYLHAQIAVALPSIEEVPLHKIDLKSPFFDSLRGDYDFDQWFQEKAREGRTTWMYHDIEGDPGAIAIFKEERDPIEPNLRCALGRWRSRLCGAAAGRQLVVSDNRELDRGTLRVIIRQAASQ